MLAIKNKSKYRLRLEKLVAFLYALPARRFDYGVFVSKAWKGAADLECGASACAFGWASTIPEFRKLGLKMVQNPLDPSMIDFMWKGRELEPEEAMQKLFGLNANEVDYLFFPGYRLRVNGEYPKEFRHAPYEDAGPKAVARHMEFFMTKKLWPGESIAQAA